MYDFYDLFERIDEKSIYILRKATIHAINVDIYSYGGRVIWMFKLY